MSLAVSFLCCGHVENGEGSPVRINDIGFVPFGVAFKSCHEEMQFIQSGGRCGCHGAV